MFQTVETALVIWEKFSVQVPKCYSEVMLRNIFSGNL